MNIAQAKCIQISSYLARQGHEPQRTRHAGRELWYHSPIRDGDETPSFKVDTIRNIWFDHGAARGGTIIDLVQDMCACSVRDALQHLDRSGLHSPTLSTPETGQPKQNAPISPDAIQPTLKTRKSAGEKEKAGPLELVSQGPLTHSALLEYLRQRRIDPEIASRYVSQIDFRGAQSAQSYFGAGYPAGEGFEARSALFKGFVGTSKNVTFHDKPGAILLQVFEGFMDFLSYLTAHRLSEPTGAALVLNSTNLWRRALPYIDDTRFTEVRLYLDNDAAGDAATRQLCENATNPARLSDMRSHYADHEDLNDWLLDQPI